MSAGVDVTGLSVSYNGEAALCDVTFAAGEGQAVAVLGPNGGGKTTLFRALLGERALHHRRRQRVGEPREHQCAWWPTPIARAPPGRTMSSPP